MKIAWIKAWAELIELPAAEGMRTTIRVRQKNESVSAARMRWMYCAAAVDGASTATHEFISIFSKSSPGYVDGHHVANIMAEAPAV
jgi:hypothetical protein